MPGNTYGMPGILGILGTLNGDDFECPNMRTCLPRQNLVEAGSWLFSLMMLPAKQNEAVFSLHQAETGEIIIDK
jgi:hypothetical protein